MQVIPAIDLRKGRCVRLRQGDPSREEVFSDDPVKVALGWKDAGARRLHVVDLDGAFAGRPMHLDVAGKIARVTGLPVQLGGGFRRLKDIEKAFAMGINRVILGTRALTDPEFRRQCAASYGSSIVVSLDGRDGRVALEGWLREGQDLVVDVAAELMQEGFDTVIFTDVTRDGTEEGPSPGRISEVTRSGLKVIVAGGVSSIGDLKMLKGIPGVVGAIVGRALYSGQLDLSLALRELEE